MMFAGSFEPAYTLIISALPSLVQPMTNKRNAVVIQSHMQDIIGVSPSRGYLRFVATPEEDVAVGGKTVAGEIDEREKLAMKEKILDAGDLDVKPSKAKRLSIRVSFPRTRLDSANHLMFAGIEFFHIWTSDGGVHPAPTYTPG
jgi:hypothetical protein